MNSYEINNASVWDNTAIGAETDVMALTKDHKRSLRFINYSRGGFAVFAYLGRVINSSSIIYLLSLRHVD